ncbi:MAG: hypothetical protein ACTSPI_17575 [Candidatus Heimdallarchaeaceae archaeon]
MAERNYVIDKPITVIYQAPNKESGLTIEVEIFLPSGVKDSNFPDFNLTERGTSGTYAGTFTPNEVGDWQVLVHKDDGDGQVTKKYSVGDYNVETVGEKISDTKTVVDNVHTKVANLDTQMDTVETKVDSIDTKVSALDTPPMIS